VLKWVGTRAISIITTQGNMSDLSKGYEKDHHEQQEGCHDDAKEKEHCIARHLVSKS